MAAEVAGLPLPVLGTIVGVVVLVLIAFLVCCCYCKNYGRHYQVSVESCDCCFTTHKASSVPPYYFSRISSDDIASYPGSHQEPGYEASDDSTGYVCRDPPVSNINQKRTLSPLPNNFDNFIIDAVVPSFKKQRSTGRYQFAVVILLSENNFDNISDMEFEPSNILGEPLLNNTYPSMPRNAANYGNYIAARPDSVSCHSEEEIFGKYSSINSPFRQLWTAYTSHNGSTPNCVLLYTWQLPCTQCTDVIIRSLNDNMYRRTSVIVAHTIYWRSESEEEHRENEKKLKKENIAVVQVPYPEYLSPG